MAFEENNLLFGSDPTERIVAIELGDTGTIKIYRRDRDGSITSEIESFHPFVWCDSDVTDLNNGAEKLTGELRYGWRVSVNSWKELIALRNGLKSAGRDFFALTDQDPDQQLLRLSRVAQGNFADFDAAAPEMYTTHAFSGLNV